MILGFVSDENFVALDDVHIEIQRGNETLAVVRSTPRGAVIADLPHGEFRITLVKSGYGSKAVDLKISSPHKPHHFRLLSDSILGYVWPRSVKTGDG